MDKFLTLLDRAAKIVEQAFPGSQFYEADGTPSHGPASMESEVDTWRFVFLGPPPYIPTTTVYLEWRSGSFATPVKDNQPFLGDHVIALPVAMDLKKAIELKDEAGHTSPFAAVVLRHPLSPTNKEPLYIFTDSSGSHVFVGTTSGHVNTSVVLHHSAGPGKENTRLCTAQGLEYKAFRRPYRVGPANVLTLLASGYYPTAPWNPYFMSDGGSSGRFALMEIVPPHFDHIVTYYAPVLCSGVGIDQLGKTIVVKDAFGDHEVAVEDYER